MLRAILHKFWRQYPTKHQLWGHLPPITKTIQIWQTSHVRHCWRSKDELMSDIILWISSHGRGNARRQARTYIQQLCADKSCSLEDFPGAMDERDGWRERVREIYAGSPTWLYIYIYIYMCVCAYVCVCVCVCACVCVSPTEIFIYRERERERERKWEGERERKRGRVKNPSFCIKVHRIPTHYCRLGCGISSCQPPTLHRWLIAGNLSKISHIVTFFSGEDVKLY